MAGVLHRRNMKKDNKMDPVHASIKESRPSSASSVSSKTSKSSSSQKSHGPKKEELIKANAELFREVENLNQENQLMKATISAVIDKFIENAKIKGVNIPKEVERANVCDIPAESLVMLAEKLTAESHKSNTMEGRVEELETRITHLNMELAKLLRTRINLENGLEEILESSSVDGAHSKARNLILEVQSSSLHTYLESIEREAGTENGLSTRSTISTADTESETQSTPVTQTRSTITVTLQDDSLDLTPPAKKSPGETHIRYMHKDLKKYVAQQLSLYKANGADWRLMGERLGIPAETLQQWRRWKLDQPMQYVLQTWSQSPTATVRLLHRHLVSPQMRCCLLAKRISDFYHVD